ncbi:MAG TPA: ABC transporter permease [Candidatus Kapabacteria bacterium]|jgi:ABC-2 type transport system permease protein
MNPRRAFAIVLRIFFLMRGSFTRIFPLFAWAAIDIILWGFITRYLDTVQSNFNFVSTMLGAVLLWDFFTRAMFGISTSFFEDVWSRNFLNLFATPLRLSEYIGGLVVASMMTSFIGLVVMLTLAALVFGLWIFSFGAVVIVILLGLFLFGIAFGIFAIGIVLRLGPAAEWFIWPMPAVLAPIAAVFYPVAVLPIWLQPLARAIPASYLFETLRAIVKGGTVPADSLWIGCTLSVVYVFLAFWFFRVQYYHAVRTGLVARYSAETLS